MIQSRRAAAGSLAFVLIVSFAELIHADPFQVVHTFTDVGEHPAGGVTAVGSVLVGTTTAETTNSTPPPYGFAYSMNLDGSNYQVVHPFTGPEGADPESSLTLVGSTLYGTTSGPRAGNPFLGNHGTVFSMKADGSNYQVLHTFSGVGADQGSAFGSLVVSGATLYGTEEGSNNSGALFSIGEDGSNFQTLHLFSGGDGASLFYGLTIIGNVLYGMTSKGGANGDGVLFSINTNGANFQIMHTFSGGADGANPTGSLVQIGSSLFGLTKNGGTANDGTLFSIQQDGSNYNLVHTFRGPDGELPVGLTTNGSSLFGVTSLLTDASLHPLANGTLFSLSPDGTNFGILHTFNAQQAGNPGAYLTFVGSSLYGTASIANGSSNAGLVFSYTVPEPGTLSLACIGAAFAWLTVRQSTRRKNRRGPLMNPRGNVP